MHRAPLADGEWMSSQYKHLGHKCVPCKRFFFSDFHLKSHLTNHEKEKRKVRNVGGEASRSTRSSTLVLPEVVVLQPDARNQSTQDPLTVTVKDEEDPLSELSLVRNDFNVDLSFTNDVDVKEEVLE